MTRQLPEISCDEEKTVLQVWIDDPVLGLQKQDLGIGDEQWFKWLATNTPSSFRFKSCSQEMASYTARREVRASDQYWYAVKKIAGKVRRVYLGRSSELTLGKLRTAAKELAAIYLDQEAHKSNTSVSEPSEIKSEVLVSLTQLGDLMESLLQEPEVTRSGRDRGSIRRAFEKLMDRLKPFSSKE